MADTKARILVVEDDEPVLELLRIRLELAGYHAFYARDGHRALEAMRNIGPDAVVLDIGLPHLDGFGVLRTMKYDRRLKDIPVLMLTARHAQSDVYTALSDGARDYLTKPFDDKVLLSRVARLLADGQARRAASSQQYFV